MNNKIIMYVVSTLLLILVAVAIVVPQKSIQTNESNLRDAQSVATDESRDEVRVTTQDVAQESQAPFSSSMPVSVAGATLSKIPDTYQNSCYNNTTSISCPQTGAFSGQDAQYAGAQPSYRDNGDGTVTDLVTGLMWTKSAGSKQAYYTAVNGADSYSYAGYSDWRVPTTKELYSLMDFRGADISSNMYGDTSSATPFIDTKYFDFSYGDVSKGDRTIDSQWITSNVYKGKVMNNQECFFGLNFADGRIKCYPTVSNNNNGYFIRYVRCTTTYGKNIFVDNGDKTITDNSSGLTWQKDDSGKGMNWESALGYCENLSLAGKSDWRLPNVKELQYLVDYSRSPSATQSAALDNIFNITSITNEAGQKDYPIFWTSTTHRSDGPTGFSEGAYVAFGRAMGKMNGTWIDVHGAGAQRSDPKTGSASNYPDGRGPQGDAIRINNYVRCVRGGATLTTKTAVDTTPLTSSTSATPPSQTTTPTSPSSAPTPPQEAINACSGKTAGTTCSFTAPNGTVSGTCNNISGTLACAPRR